MRSQQENTLSVLNIHRRYQRLIGWLSASYLGLRIISVFALLLIWWFITEKGWVDPIILPSPKQVIAQLVSAAGDLGFMGVTLWEHLWASLSRILLALLSAVIIGIPVGIAMGISKKIQAILDPWIEFYRPVPPLAYLPLIVIWFGIGEFSKILLIWASMLPPVILSTVAGVQNANVTRIRAARSLGANRRQLLTNIILPNALPEILIGLRIGLGVGWSTLVAAELIAATQGLGFMVQSAGEFLSTDMVIAGICVIALIACTLELGLRVLQKRLVPWYGAKQ
ncbi:taurine ABC transporter permease [Xenorhabdus mauleonii]|uniref:Taurine ABC transporter permease n=1 Tax=Xenorhabdus mauleonii TaxID=351675 RepID=A0A1I3N1A0_9GAMM|nr:taurine ABC transporter permease TauC [Xenorhabdus mauleonii]PHM45823.1 taurine ABC transporter permease [Xenorhabdus mauleonii]SFJ02686.1 taurine transport system permease protein [Xenorhabdus mauleonii]